MRRSIWLGSILAIGCGGDTTEAAVTVPASATAAATTYASIVSATYEDALTDVELLDGAIDAFLADRTPEKFALAKEAWLDARETYLQSEVFRFYDGPIDHPDTGVEGSVNAWPLDEAFIDYVDGNAQAGLINDPTTPITAEELESLNGSGGEENVATGFHAIEFLLWGQDHSVDGPGDRTFGDYVDAPGGKSNVDRRAKYLETVSDLLVAHIGKVNEAWAPARDYRVGFEGAAREESLRRILTGVTVLSGFETGGERLQTALDSGSQEDEHSCFSDNTHRDMVQDVRGIQNVWLGKYTRLDGTTVEGTSVRDVVTETDAALAESMTTRIATSLTLAEALKTPFDQEIATSNTEGRKRVSDLIDSLRLQAKLAESIFRLYSLAIPVTE